MKKIICTIYSVLLTVLIFSQNNIGFFSFVSNSKDNTTLLLTQDTFFSQVSNLNTYTIKDLREIKFSDYDITTNTHNIDLAFYIELQESPSGWNTILHAIRLSDLHEYTVSKQYESYYIILMNVKSDINDLFATISTTDSGNNDRTKGIISNNNNWTIDMLSGNWTGENNIVKIVLLRSGRGFVIYKNGASMNVSVEISGNELTITQTSNQNASYFPEIPREIALSIAPTAPLIKWTLNISSEKLLEGTKYTLMTVYENQNAVSAQPGTEQVQWIKQ